VCCSVLQCVAVCCSVLQCVAVCCSVMQCVAVCCLLLQCVAVCCSVLQCAAVCCVTMRDLLYRSRRVYVCVRVCVCMCKCICMCVCKCVCKCVCMYVYTHAMHTYQLTCVNVAGADSEYTCNTCSSGTYSPSAGASSCLACPANSGNRCVCVCV